MTENPKLSPRQQLTEQADSIRYAIAQTAIEIANLKIRTKTAKTNMEELVESLRTVQAQAERDEIQPALPFPEGPPPLATGPASVASSVDAGGQVLLSSLAGISSGRVEKLAELDPPVLTVADLEKYMAAGNLVPGRVKGIGQTAVDQITDALMAHRAAVPMPDAGAGADDSPAVEAAAVSADDDTDETTYGTPEETAAYAAGCGAAAEGRRVTANPHDKGTPEWCAWDDGWQDTNAYSDDTDED